MVRLGPFQSQPHRDRPLAGRAIRIEIANVVDVEHRHRQQAAAGGRQQQQGIERHSLHKVTAEDAHPTKEDQHCQVAKTGITIRRSPGRIGDGRRNGRSTQHGKHQRQHEPVGAKGDPKQGQTGRYCYQGAKNDSATHLRSRHQPALHGPLWPLSVAGVGTVDRVTVVVGEVGKNLQQNGRQQAKSGHKPTEFSGGRRQRRPHNDTSRRQGQRARSYCIDPDRSLVGRAGDLSHNDIKI